MFGRVGHSLIVRRIKFIGIIMTTETENTKNIRDRFSTLGIELDITEIDRRYNDLIGRFKVAPAEAASSVISYFLREHGIKREDYYTGGNSGEIVSVDAIDAPDEWVNIRVKVVKLWADTPDAIDQSGILADSTGQIKFSKFVKSALPKLVEGKCYTLSNMTTDEYNGRIGVKLNRTTKIEEFDGDIEVADRTTPTVTIDSIDASDKWINLNAKVVDIWDNEHESIDQVGLVGDETGQIKFIKWAASELPPLEEGKSYSFENIITDEYEGRFSVKFNRNSTATLIDNDIEVRPQTVEFSGALVLIRDGSGLIRRCPECNRALVKGNCSEHGNVEGVHDLRIKGVIDDGYKTQDILCNCETTEGISRITLDEAKQMATDALDQDVVVDRLREELVGKYYTIVGNNMEQSVLVTSINAMDVVDAAEVETTLSEVE